MNKPKDFIVILLKCALVIGIIVYLVHTKQLDLEKISTLFKKTELLLGIWSMDLFVLVPLTALRWSLVLKAFEIPIPFTLSLRLTMIGIFFNSILPGAVTGDIIKGYYLTSFHSTLGKTKGVLSLLIDRIIGLFGILFLGFIFTLLAKDTTSGHPFLYKSSLFISFATLFSISCGIAVLYGSEKIKRYLEHLKQFPFRRIILNILESFLLLKSSPRLVLATILLSLSIPLIYFLFFEMIASHLDILTPSLEIHILIMILGLLSINIPLAPSGIGVGHIAFAFLYGLVGIESGADIFNLFIITQFSFSLACGIVYLFSKNSLPKKQP